MLTALWLLLPSASAVLTAAVSELLLANPELAVPAALWLLLLPL